MNPPRTKPRTPRTAREVAEGSLGGASLDRLPRTKPGTRRRGNKWMKGMTEEQFRAGTDKGLGPMKGMTREQIMAGKAREQMDASKAREQRSAAQVLRRRK